ncbi:Acetylornithine deacetylase [Salmonella enterica subsp. enterica]|uniref:Acetylornithine deacetylase n=1 Tax=Salmonella enterica I TaxID=59201 RepID=A0A379X4R7_SALET|nr:Acetylornithine deacetylase [Salmonella enterica subsp. enterica]
MTLNDLNGLLNDALAPVSERWPGRLTVAELHPPIQVMSVHRTTNWLK